MVTIPSIHLNGTLARSLCAEIRDVVDALAIARRALQNMTVHGRDHYVKLDKESFSKARAEHEARFAAIDNLEKELTEIYLGIRDQV